MPSLQDPIVPRAPENPLLPYLSAYIGMAGINAKRQQLELSLQKMENQNALAEQRLYLAGQNYQSLESLRQVEAANAEARTNKIKDAANKAIDLADDTVSVQNQINSIDDEPGTKGWFASLQKIRGDNPRFFETKQGQELLKQNIQNHQISAKEALGSKLATIKEYGDLLKANGLKYFDETQWGTDDKTGLKYRPMDATGNWLPLNTPSTTPGIKYHHMSPKDFNKLKDLQDSIPNLMSEGYSGSPDVGAAAAGANAETSDAASKRQNAIDVIKSHNYPVTEANITAFLNKQQ